MCLVFGVSNGSSLIFSFIMILCWLILLLSAVSAVSFWVLIAVSLWSSLWISGSTCGNFWPISKYGWLWTTILVWGVYFAFRVWWRILNDPKRLFISHNSWQISLLSSSDLLCCCRSPRWRWSISLMDWRLFVASSAFGSKKFLKRSYIIELNELQLINLSPKIYVYVKMGWTLDVMLLPLHGFSCANPCPKNNIFPTSFPHHHWRSSTADRIIWINFFYKDMSYLLMLGTFPDLIRGGNLWVFFFCLESAVSNWSVLSNSISWSFLE